MTHLTKGWVIQLQMYPDSFGRGVKCLNMIEPKVSALNNDLIKVEEGVKREKMREKREEEIGDKKKRRR